MMACHVLRRRGPEPARDEEAGARARQLHRRPHGAGPAARRLRAQPTRPCPDPRNRRRGRAPPAGYRRGPDRPRPGARDSAAQDRAADRGPATDGDDDPPDGQGALRRRPRRLRHRRAALSRSEEHTSELQSRGHLVCRLLLEKKKKKIKNTTTLKKKKKQK